MVWPAVIAGVASLAGTAMSNAANAKQARKQMRFQERMSNTAHQREAADLEAAGLNRILTATGGSGASTPGGAMAHQADMLTPGVSSAREVARTRAEIKNLEEQNAQIKAATNLTKQQKAESAARTEGQALTNQFIPENFRAQIASVLANANSATQSARMNEGLSNWADENQGGWALRSGGTTAVGLEAANKALKALEAERERQANKPKNKNGRIYQSGAERRKRRNRRKAR